MYVTFWFFLIVYYDLTVTVTFIFTEIQLLDMPTTLMKYNKTKKILKRLNPLGFLSQKI